MQDATVHLDPLTPEALSELIADRAVAALVTAVGQLLTEERFVKKAWTKQDSKQVRKHGPDAASWYAEWIDPEGHRRTKSFGPGEEGKAAAERHARKVADQLNAGTYETNLGKTWQQFRREYEAKVLSGYTADGLDAARRRLANFERLARPAKMTGVNTQMIDGYRAARRNELRQYSAAEPVKPATVNAEIRCLRTALRKAKQWGYLDRLPEFEFLREPKSLPVYVTPDDFGRLYGACDAPAVPAVQGLTAGDWWRALLVFVYVGTGWRIGQCLGLEWADVDLYDAGTVLGRPGVRGNKARSEVLVRLHPVVREHLAKVRGFGEKVFPWPHNRSVLRKNLLRVCRRAGVRAYDWRALRRGFGTMNAPRLTVLELQSVMQHANLETTQRFYLNPSAWQEDMVARMHIPDVLKRDAG
jgi:integrase